MGHDFGNNFSDGHTAKSYEYQPRWVKNVDYNPDHQPSSSDMFTRIVEKNGEVSYFVFFPVHGLGVITIRYRPDPTADRPGQLIMDSVAILEKSLIGYAPDL